MIYVTVGTHMVATFDRLLAAMDEIAKDLSEPVFAQIGPTSFIPQHMQSADYLPYGEAMRRLREATLIISHAGIGTTLLARRYGKRLILVPRAASLGEHFNDHQVEIARRLEGRPGVRVVPNPADLKSAVLELLAESPPSSSDWGNGLNMITARIRTFLNLPPDPKLPCARAAGESRSG